MKLLLHICCSPCLTFPLKQLSQEGFEITGFWYNPNIHPLIEYQKRLDSLKSFTQKKNLKIVYKDSYDLEEFFKKALFNWFNNGESLETRCQYCYEMRLSLTASEAKKQGFENFSTTLLVSPYQKHNVLKEVGERVGKDLGVNFYYRDFRPGYYDGRRMAKEANLYLQKYCGCIFSEKERALEKLNKIAKKI
jgi:predicted adenine nucleotide alpha hydrolase (AANH) superfamily ATPase